MAKESVSLNNLWKVLLTLILLIYALIAAKSILIPIVFAGFLSLVLNPMVSYLERKKFPAWLAILSTLIFVTSIVFLGIYFVSSQAQKLLSELPNLMDKYNALLNNVESQVGELFGVSGSEQIALIKENSSGIISSSTGFLSGALSATSNFLSFMTLLPIYIVFMLLSRQNLKLFIVELGKRRKLDYLKLVGEIKSMVYNYIGGLLIVVSIISALNTIGLLCLGIEHAIFLGILSGALTVIPYIGILVGGSIPVIVALLTKDSLFYPLAVIALIALVQFLEGNFITPKIMGNKININPLAAIVSLLVGATIWGIVGMILAIPLLGIVKIIFSHISALKPYAILLSSAEELD